MRTIGLALLYLTRTLTGRTHRARLASHIRRGHSVLKYRVCTGSARHYYGCSCGKGWVR